MKQKPPSEARSIGSYLSDPLLSVRRLMTEADRLTQLQIALREWLPSAVRDSIRVAAEQEGTLTLHVSSAAALVAIRYCETELLRHLQQSATCSATRVVTKVVPQA